MGRFTAKRSRHRNAWARRGVPSSEEFLVIASGSDREPDYIIVNPDDVRRKGLFLFEVGDEVRLLVWASPGSDIDHSIGPVEHWLHDYTSGWMVSEYQMEQFSAARANTEEELEAELARMTEGYIYGDYGYLSKRDFKCTEIFPGDEIYDVAYEASAAEVEEIRAHYAKRRGEI